MGDSVLSVLRQFGVGCRLPTDELFKENNEISEATKTFGVIEVDEEDFLHCQLPTFVCHAPGCSESFETVLQYDQHYNSCHRYSCSECNKCLPSSHLLDLHLSETHDAFFAAQAERKPMFQCYLEKCKEVFKNAQDRRDHCISFHKFPSDFRFDEARKQKHQIVKKKQNKKTKANAAMEVDEGTTVTQNQQMELSNLEASNSEKSEISGKKTAKKKSGSYSSSRGRKKPILSNFTKDLMSSLPS